MLANGNFSVVELFCGCGGFSHGFELTNRFETVLGVDIKDEASKTFIENHKNAALIKSDIREIPDIDIVNKLQSKGVVHLDCLIGGPPCQGFSQMRRNESRDKSSAAKYSGYSKLQEDKRNDLILRFLEIAALLMPKCVVIENVKQVKNHMLNGKEGGFISAVEDILGGLGYEVTHTVLNAADYGVPQARERAFIIASRISQVSFPSATHQCQKSISTNDLPSWVSVDDAISDLPEPEMKKDIMGGQATELYLNSPSNTYQELMRLNTTYFPYNHITRTYKHEIINIISCMPQGKTWVEVSKEKRSEYDKLIKEHSSFNDDEKAKEDLINSGIINPVFYKDYYWSAYTRLHSDMPSLTITANANFLGSGRFTHPYMDRGITPREAARLQSFPDNFTFLTSKDDSYSTERSGIAMDMIGEAVPPLLAKSIANHIANYLINHYENV